MPRPGHGARAAIAGALVLSLACIASLTSRAPCQPTPARTVSGLRVADSLLSAEFAKDSLGSLTVGVVAGAQLA